MATDGNEFANVAMGMGGITFPAPIITPLPYIPAQQGAPDWASSGSITVLDDSSAARMLAAQVERLIGIIELSPEERAFVRAALAPQPGKDFWLVLADFLLDRQKDEAAAKIRSLSKETP